MSPAATFKQTLWVYIANSLHHTRAEVYLGNIQQLCGPDVLAVVGATADFVLKQHAG